MTHAGNWMLDEVAWVQGVRHVVVATSDGLVTARSEGTSDEIADRLAAACAGLHSLGRSIGKEFGSARRDVQQVMVGFDGGFLFVRRAGDGSHLAVITEQVVDPGLIGQQMQAQVVKIGQVNLATPPRRSRLTTGT